MTKRIPDRLLVNGHEHHTVLVGAIDRGLKSSPFEVVSRSNRTGEIIRTRHRTMDKALKASFGRLGQHTMMRINDHRPPQTLGDIMADALEPKFDDGGPYNEPTDQELYDRLDQSAYEVIDAGEMLAEVAA